MSKSCPHLSNRGLDADAGSRLRPLTFARAFRAPSSPSAERRSGTTRQPTHAERRSGTTRGERTRSCPSAPGPARHAVCLKSESRPVVPVVPLLLPGRWPLCPRARSRHPSTNLRFRHRDPLPRRTPYRCGERATAGKRVVRRRRRSSHRCFFPPFFSLSRPAGRRHIDERSPPPPRLPSACFCSSRRYGTALLREAPPTRTRK